MLVPDLRVTPVCVREWAATTWCPGALSSGLSRPSRVGPSDEKKEIGVEVLWASYEATTRLHLPQEIDPSVRVLSCGGENCDGLPSSRSIQAWNFPSPEIC